MLQSEPDGRSGPAGGAAANGIHDHQHGAAPRSEQAVNILRSSGLFYAVSSEILAHCGNEWFGVGHSLILPYKPPLQCRQCPRDHAALS